MNWTSYHCPDCDFKTKFTHYNSALAELRKHRALERTVERHPSNTGKPLIHR